MIAQPRKFLIPIRIKRYRIGVQIKGAQVEKTSTSFVNYVEPVEMNPILVNI